MSNIFNRQVGTRLRQMRKLKGLTQQQLAELMGISFQQVQKYESGLNSLSFERVCQLSHLLGVTLPDWVGGMPVEENFPSLSVAPHEGEGKRQALSLLRAYHSIDDDTKKTLLCSMAKALAQANPPSSGTVE